MAVAVVHHLDRRGGAPQEARAHVRAFCRAVGSHVSDEVVQDIELVVSELVTNAVLHAAGEIALRLELVDGVVSLGVLDGGRAQLPVTTDGDAGQDWSEGGRGLALVAELSREWGIRPDGSGGKEVWAHLPREQEAR